MAADYVTVDLYPNLRQFIVKTDENYNYNGYCLDIPEGSVLIDLTKSDQIGPVKRYLKNKDIKGIISTHRTTRGEIDKMAEEIPGCAVYVANEDADGLPVSVNPIGNKSLQSLGLECIPCHGKSPGSFIIKWDSNGGVLFAGGCAIGGKKHSKSPEVLKPSMLICSDAGELSKNLASIGKIAKLDGFCPYIGEPVVKKGTILPAYWPPTKEAKVGAGCVVQ